MTQKIIKALFVDDNDEVRDTVPTRLQTLLKEEGIDIEIIPLSNIEDAITFLDQKPIHLIIVDLRFDAGGKSGNEIIKIILETKILPIIVFSGYSGELDTDFSNHELIFVSPSKRAPDVVEKIKIWHSQKVFSLFSEDGYLSSLLRQIMQKTMWEKLSLYWTDFYTDNIDEMKLIAGRMASSLLIEQLTSSPEFVESGGEIQIHPGEIYLFESDRPYLSVGDLLSLDKLTYVVLSPSCDLIPRANGETKAKEILLVRCHDLKAYIAENEDIQIQIKYLNNADASPTKKDNAKEKILKLMRQDWKNDAGQLFFLPPFASFDGGVVDFLDMKIELYNGKIIKDLVKSRIVSIQRDLASELASRYARHMIRLGQSTYLSDPLIASITGLAKIEE